ncbi:MAG: restriction endonuclease subunit S [Pseudomonadales bacterium]
MSQAIEARTRLIFENEIPSIPKDWAVERFRFLFVESKERNGSQPTGEMLSVSEYRGVVPRDYEHEEQRRSDKELENYRVVRPGQLAVNTMWLNHLGLGVSDHLGHVSPAYAVYDISDRLSRRFAHHLLRSQFYLKIYLRYLYGIRPNSYQIKADDWKSIPIIVPPPEMQLSIAEFLDRETSRIEQLIEKKKKFIEMLTLSRQAIAKSTLQDIFPSSIPRDAQEYIAGYYDGGWSVQRVKHIVTYMTSGSRGWSQYLADEGEVFLQSGNIGREMEVLFDDAQRVEPQTGTEAKRTAVAPRDILVCITGGRTGAVGYVPDINENAYINQHICLLRAREHTIHPKLLAHLLYSEIGQKQLEFFQYGLKQGLGFAQVGEVRIPIPPVSLQESIVKKIDSKCVKTDELSRCVGESITKLQEYRAALITAAVTGQIDVATWGKRGETDRRLDQIEAEMSQQEASG